MWWSSTSGVFLDKQIRREADNDHYDQVHLNHNNQHDHLDEQSVSRDHHDMVVIINTWCVSSASKQGQRLIMDHPASDGPEYTKHQPCIIITDVIVATSTMAQVARGESSKPDLILNLRTEESLFTSYGWPHFQPLRPQKSSKILINWKNSPNPVCRFVQLVPPWFEEGNFW